VRTALTLGDFRGANSTEPDSREFTGWSWTVPAYEDDSLGWPTRGDEIKVWIQGVQRPDGRTKRESFISDRDNALTIGAARQFAAALRAAVDEAELMNHYDEVAGD
jgi:hypothetical protein